MNISVKSSLERFNRISARLQGAGGEDDAIRRGLSKQLLFERTRIVLRTKRGLDVFEKDFQPPYSTGYASAKRRGVVKQDGRKVKAASRQTGHVNLTLTGAMLKSLQVTTKRISRGAFEGIVYIGPAQAWKAKYALDYGRKFFGFSKKAKKRILRALQEAVLDYKISQVLK